MKSLLLIGIAFAVLGFFQNALAQSAEPWKRIVNSDGKVSFAFPPDVLFDTDPKLGTFFAFHSTGAREISLRILDKKSLVNLGISEGTSATFGDIFVVKKDDPVTNRIGTLITIVKKGEVFRIRVDADSPDDPVAARFLKSIKIGDRFVISGSASIPDSSETTIGIGKLATSPEVVDARKREMSSRDRKPEPAIGRNPADFLETADVDRKAMIVDQPNVVAEPDWFRRITGYGFFRAKVRMELLANGQIGKIRLIYDNFDQFGEKAFKAAEKIRFVPAMKNGRPVDSFRVVSYDVEYNVVTNIYVQR